MYLGFESETAGRLPAYVVGLRRPTEGVVTCTSAISGKDTRPLSSAIAIVSKRKSYGDAAVAHPQSEGSLVQIQVVRSPKITGR